MLGTRVGSKHTGDPQPCELVGGSGDDVLSHDGQLLASTERCLVLTDSTGTNMLIKTDMLHPDATTSSLEASPVTTPTFEGSGV